MGQEVNPYFPRGERDANTSALDNQPVRPVQSRAQGPPNPYLPGADVEIDPLRRALRQGVQVPQTRAMRIEELRVQLGIPSALIDANFDELDKRQRAGQVNPDDLRRIAPALARWLGQDGTKAAAVAPDLQKLANVEQHLGLSADIMRGWNQNVQGNLYGTLETLGQLSGDVSAYQYGKEGRERNRIEALAYGQIDFAHVFDSPGNIATFVRQLVGEQLPVMGAQLGARGVGAVAGAPFPGGVTIGGTTGAFAMSVAMGVGEMQSLLHELDPEGHHPVAALIGGTGIGSLDFITAGFLGSFGSRSLRYLAKATGVSRRVGGTGLGTALAQRFGVAVAEPMARKILLTPVQPRFLVRTAAGTVTAASSEALTEAAQKVVADVTGYTATGTPMDWRRTLTEAAFEGLAGGIVGGIYGLPGETLGGFSERRQAIQAEQQKAFFQALGNGVKDVESLSKLPASMAEFVAMAADDHGIPQFFVPTSSFEEYWQTKHINPGFIAEQLTGDRTALDTAKREGVDLAIPTEAYATLIAPTEHHAFFVNELKLDPQVANTREVTEEVTRAEARAQAAPEAEATADQQRRTIASLVEEGAVARGTPRFTARVLGQLYGRRYVERAETLGLDPVELYQARGETIAVEFPAGAGARSLLPLVQQGVETEANIPASPAPVRETPEQRGQRRTTQVAAVTSAVLREAQRTDPLVDPDLVAREVEAWFSWALERQVLQRESGRGQALLRAVAGRGGVRVGEGRWSGEIQRLAAEGRDVRERRDRGTSFTWNQVPGVFQEAGQPLDVLLQSLQQDPEFQGIQSDDELLLAIEDALRAKPDTDALPGTAEMRALGIVPGERWWDEAWTAVPEEDLSDSVETGEGPITFDPNEFLQRRARAARLADLTRRAGEATGDEFYQRTPPQDATGPSALRSFYSRLERAVQAAKVDTATGRDWKAIIRGSKAGINQDEYRFVGVDSLEDRRRYTRDEVLGFLFEHQVQIEPVELVPRNALFTAGELEAETDRIYRARVEEELSEWTEGRFGSTRLSSVDVVLDTTEPEMGVDAYVDGQFLGAFETESEAQRAADASVDAQNAVRARNLREDVLARVSWEDARAEAEQTLAERHRDREAHFSSYTQPGAIDGSYRELFFTAPNAGTPPTVMEQQLKQLDLVLDHWRELAVREREGPSPDSAEAEDVARVVAILEHLREFPSVLTPDVQGDFRMLNRRDNDFLQSMMLDLATTMTMVTDRRPVAWQDGHPDYDNITNPIVRVRYNVRQIKPVLDVAPTPTPVVVQIGGGQWAIYIGGAPLRRRTFASEAEANAAAQRLPPAARLVEALTETVLFLEEIQPPQTAEFAKMPALFQKQWRELAMRWALQHAVNQGYDRVAWTTGEMQVKRWPALRQHAETIHWYAEDKTLIAIDREGNQLVSKAGIEERNLGRYIGEDNARTLLAADPALISRQRGLLGGQRYTLEGQNMAVGGTGLVKLYDEDFTRVLNSLPVMRRSKTKAGAFDLPDIQQTTTYTGPAVTQEQLRVDARESISDPSHPMSVSLGRQAGVVAEEMHRGLSFAEAMVTYGSIALANYYGGELTTGLDAETVPGVVLTPALREALVSGQEFFDPGDQGDLPKGGYNRLTRVLRGFAGRMDLSTLLHETGHAFVSQLMEDAQELTTRDPATLTDRQQQAVADAHTVLRWFQFDGTTSDWLGLSRDQQEAMHEQWARGFEAYLMTGKAPVPELQSLFQMMRQWLLEAYKLLLVIVDQQKANQVLQVELTDEVRQVMDRLFASDAAIAAAREAAVDPLFTDQASAGVDSFTWATYLKDVREGHAAAREALDARLLQEWRKTQQANWQGEREKVKGEVEGEAGQQPVYIALSVIRTGKLPNGTIPSFGDGQPMKLSKTAIVQMKGAAFAKQLPRPYLYTVQGGLHPDVVAELVGFTSGDALLDALLEAKPYRQVVDAEADLRMRDAHGDMLFDGIELQALAEAHLQEHRAKVIAAELQALTKGMARAALPSAAALRAAAETRIARTRVVDLRPGLFLAAAKRASQRAFDAFARNDRAGAIAAKQEEQSTLALYQAAIRAKERSEKTASLLREYQTSRGRRKSLLAAGEDYLDQVDALLERFEFTRTTQKAQGRRAALATWIEQQRKQGIAVDGIPQWVIDDARVVNYTQLTTEALEGVRQSVEHLAHLARLKNKLLDAREQRALDEIRTELATSIRDKHPEREPILEPRRKLERFKKGSAGFLWSHLTIADIARRLDVEDGGPVWRYGILPLNTAALNEGAKMGATLTALEKIFKQHYTANERANLKRKVKRPELNSPKHPQASLSKEALLMMAANQANDTNRQRLRDGYGWSQEQVALALDAYLDKRDWDFVQDVINYLDTYWPDILAKQQRVAGFAPQKVEGTPIFTRFGEYAGGYFPIKWEGETSSKNFDLEQDSLADIQKAAAYVHSTTARGHLERRVEGDVINRPVRLDFGVITDHLAQVIHDLTHHEALLDVSRVMGSEEVRSAISETLGIGAWEQWRTAMRDIAVGDIPARQEGEGVLGWLNNGVSIAGLGLNVMSASIQWVGITQSVQRIGAKWVGQGLTGFLRGAVGMDDTVKGVLAESALMRQRADNQSPEMQDARRRLGLDTGRITGWLGEQLSTVTAGRYERVAMADSYFWMITRAQLMVDFPTYLGARAKAAADPRNRNEDGTLDVETIVAIAEQALISAQGSGYIKDRAAIQKGGPAWQVWTKFFSFFRTTYALWAESYKRATGGRVLPSPRNPAAVGRLAVDFLLLITIPTILTHVTRSALRGTLDDELEDPEEFIWALVRENISYMANMLVIVREFAGIIEGAAGYEGPAGARGFSAVSKLIAEIGQMEVDEAMLRSLNTTAGIVFHYPAGTVEKVVRGIKALVDGETDNPLAPVVGPPPKQ